MSSRFHSLNQNWRVRLATGAPILALVALVVLFSFGLLWNFARQQDRAFVDTTTRLVESALTGRAEATSGISVDYAIWHDAYLATTRRLDTAWLENNFYSNATDALFVIDGEGRVLYAWTSDATSVDALQAQVEELPASLNLPSLLRSTNPAEITASTMALANDSPAFVAVTPISAERDGALSPRDTSRPARYLVAIDLLSSEELSALGHNLQIEGLHFEAAAVGRQHRADHAGALRFPIGANASLGSIAWTRRTPGRDALAGQFGASIAVLVLLGFAAFALAARMANMHLAAHARMQAAEDANRLRAEFSAEVNERVNGPLNVLVGYSELIEEEAEDLGPHARNIRDDARKMRAAAQELSKLLRDAMKHSRIDGGHITLVSERIETSALLEETRELTASTALLTGASMSAHIDPDAREFAGDLVSLQQCLVHLSLNAMRRTPGKEISVRVHRVVERGVARLSFDFADQGAPVTPDRAALLFKPFGDGESEAEASLGLSTTKGLAQLMGGDVRVSNPRGGGAVFSLLLPASANSSPTATSGARRRAS